MIGQLERIIQASLKVAPSLVTQVAAILQAPADTVFITLPNQAYGSGAYGSGAYGVGSGGAPIYGIADAITTHAPIQQLILDSGTQGFLDEDYLDSVPAVLTVGGFVLDAAGNIGKLDLGAVLNP